MITENSKHKDPLIEFMKHYSRESQERDRRISNKPQNEKLTLADLQNARDRPRTRYFIKEPIDDY